MKLQPCGRRDCTSDRPVVKTDRFFAARDAAVAVNPFAGELFLLMALHMYNQEGPIKSVGLTMCPHCLRDAGQLCVSPGGEERRDKEGNPLWHAARTKSAQRRWQQRWTEALKYADHVYFCHPDIAAWHFERFVHSDRKDPEVLYAFDTFHNIPLKRKPEDRYALLRGLLKRFEGLEPDDPRV